MGELRKIPMRVEFIDVSVVDSVQYRLRSIDELYHLKLGVMMHISNKPNWVIGEIVEIDVPMESQREGITMRKLREVAKGKGDGDKSQ
jgi:hypothetical protein